MLTGPYLIRTISTRYSGLLHHDALVLPASDGQYYALDITLVSERPQATPLDAYLLQHQGEVVSLTPLPNLDTAQAWARFQELKEARRYNAITYNCDHLINELLTDQRGRSRQVWTYASAALLSALALLLLLYIAAKR